jgi:hypothetical protein
MSMNQPNQRIAVALTAVFGACGEETDTDTELDTANDAVDVTSFEADDVTPSEVSDEPADVVESEDSPSCPERLSACDSSNVPMEASILRGVVGIAVYESDVVFFDCEPECLATAVELLLISTVEVVTEQDQAREVLSSSAEPWATFDGGFQLEAGPEPGLLCLRFPEEGLATAVCAGLEFDDDVVYRAILKTQFGPSEIYLVRNSTGVRVATYEVDLQ